MYLTQLYRHSRLAFIGVVLFIIGQVFFTYKGIENFPFFNYGMYSEPFAAQAEHRTPILHLNDRAWSPYGHWRLPNDFVHHTLHSYVRLVKNGGNDPIETTIQSRFAQRVDSATYTRLLASWSNRDRVSHYLAWLKRYLQPAHSEPIRSLSIWEKTYCYQPYSLIVVDSQQITEF